MTRSTPRLLTGALLLALLSSPALASDDDGDEIKFKAFFHGDMQVEGRAVYKEELEDGGLEREFKIKIENAQPGQSFDVFLNGVYVDTVTARADGSVEYELESDFDDDFDDDSDDDHFPMPDDFPAIGTGDTIVVGDLSGCFYQAGREHRRDRQRYKLEAESAGGDIDVEVDYKERMRYGRLRRTFDVEIEDAEPGDAYDVFVNGDFVGRVVIDDEDEGELELRTERFIRDGDHRRLPMPDDFPTLVPGDVVSVGPHDLVLEIDD